MQQHFSLNDILAFEQRFRAQFINSLGGFKSLVLIGTVNRDGQPNLTVFNSFVHLGANPPLFGLVARPDSVERHTLANILDTREFTVNHVREAIFEQAHQTSARYPHSVSEFEAVGLTPEFAPDFRPPFVQESSVKIGATLVRHIELPENGTTFIIAKIDRVSVPENCIGSDGFVNLEKAGTLTCSGLDSYHTTSRIVRLAYAKPELPPRRLDA